MLKAIKSVWFDILSYILAFIFSILFILVSSLFPDEFKLLIVFGGVIFSFYISNVLVDKIR
jgi:hypothetical protein